MKIISTFKKLTTTLSLNIFKIFKLKRIIKKINNLYKDTPTYSLSKQARSTQDNNPNLVYGELSIKSFIYLLALLAKPNGCKILDIGCGDAKLLHSAALFFKHINITGIEIVPEVYQVAQDKLNQLQSEIKDNHNQVKIINEDASTYSLQNFNIVYMCLSALEDPNWQAIVKQLESLKPGSKVISIARKINHPNFKPIYIAVHPASWGPASVYIYQRE